MEGAKFKNLRQHFKFEDIIITCTNSDI